MAFEKGHALLIGVGLYGKIPTANVPVASSDANAVAAVLKDPNTCGYPPENVKMLLNEAATKAGTLAALDELAASTGEEDTVFLFYCGHGATGEDGNYYFVSHDAEVRAGRVLPGTGVSEAEFIDRLRAIKAKRLLVTLNTCYSGNVSPALDLEDQEMTPSSPPQDTTSAILATGTGRIIITASGEQQVSYIGSGPQSIFTQALTDALRGKGVANHGGYISAFNLYEYVYETVSEAVEQLASARQEPELTVLKGVGPFAVALFRGATSLGDFDSVEPAPSLPTVIQVKPEKAQRLMNNIRINSPDTTISNADGVISGHVGGDVHQKIVKTGGGAYVDGNVDTHGGDFVGRDKKTPG